MVLGVCFRHMPFVFVFEEVQQVMRDDVIIGCFFG